MVGNLALAGQLQGPARPFLPPVCLGVGRVQKRSFEEVRAWSHPSYLPVPRTGGPMVRHLQKA